MDHHRQILRQGQFVWCENHDFGKSQPQVMTQGRLDLDQILDKDHRDRPLGQRRFAFGQKIRQTVVPHTLLVSPALVNVP